MVETTLCKLKVFSLNFSAESNGSRHYSLQLKILQSLRTIERSISFTFQNKLIRDFSEEILTIENPVLKTRSSQNAEEEEARKSRMKTSKTQPASSKIMENNGSYKRPKR
ncbi:hypothetical protein Trydic_g3959 [Trypoxylus dichotomus]